MPAACASQPYRQAVALSHAMSRRPTPQLGTLYFETLKKMIGGGDEQGRTGQEEPGDVSVRSADRRGTAR